MDRFFDFYFPDTIFFLLSFGGIFCLAASMFFSIGSDEEKSKADQAKWSRRTVMVSVPALVYFLLDGLTNLTEWNCAFLALVAFILYCAVRKLALYLASR